MNIALCTDDNYAKYCMITIVSILENNRNANCTIYVLTNLLNEKNRSSFEYLAAYYNQKILITIISSEQFDKLKVRSRYPKSMYYRFILPEIIKEDRVLYLDCDIINKKSLEELYMTNLDGYAAAVIEDAQGDDVMLHNRIKYSGTYFNSGVILMNLDYWRKNKIKDKLCKFIHDNPERCYYPDQDALNIVLENEVRFVPFNNNLQQPWYGSLEKITFSFTKWGKVCDALKDPVLVHYTATNKPWFKECDHPHRDWFLEYANLHKEIDFVERRRLKRSRVLISLFCEKLISMFSNSRLVISRK